MSSSFPHRCWAEIDLGILTENVRRIRKHLPADIRYISVLKADSYGLGAHKTAPALRAGGADIFAVANIAEAAELREIDQETPILLLSATIPEEDTWLWEFQVIPTISTPDEAQRYQQIAATRGILPVHVKIDTGMGRLGIWHEQIDELAAAFAQAPDLRIEGIYSHFASSGENPAFTAQQRQRLQAAIPRLAPASATERLFHIDNSSALANFPADQGWNAVRVGLLQYGVLPTADSPLQKFDVQPALSWHTKVSVVKNLPAGASVGYGRSHRLTADTRIAVVTAGYADGIPRTCTNRGFLLVHGKCCPILGSVTMDEIMIDVSAVSNVHPGDTATIIGRQESAEITIHEFSQWAGTIPWESMCAISKRVHRVYRP